MNTWENEPPHMRLFAYTKYFFSLKHPSEGLLIHREPEQLLQFTGSFQDNKSVGALVLCALRSERLKVRAWVDLRAGSSDSEQQRCDGPVGFTAWWGGSALSHVCRAGWLCVVSSTVCRRCSASVGQKRILVAVRYYKPSDSVQINTLTMGQCMCVNACVRVWNPRTQTQKQACISLPELADCSWLGVPPLQHIAHSSFFLVPGVQHSSALSLRKGRWQRDGWCREKRLGLNLFLPGLFSGLFASLTCSFHP